VSLRGASLAVALAIGLCSLGAAAQSGDQGAAADIEGGWSFETAVYDITCHMTGELILKPSGTADVYLGDLVAYESCNGRQIYEARQSVIARRDGDRLEIASTLVRVLPSPENYAPDNFALTIVNGALMEGQLRSADIAPATFRRREALVS
jgi:hypothetical protein